MSTKPATSRNKSKLTLEDYLKTCQVNKDNEHYDVFNFDDAIEAYEFGKKLREIAMKEEGVLFADKMEKFSVDISYMTVRIKLLIGELARC